MRAAIARRLTESKQTVPHFYLTASVEIDALLVLRESLNRSSPICADGAPAFRLSVNDFIVKALALALQRVPAANTVWDGDRLLRHRASDVGVAIAVEGGLLSPVVRDADRKTLQEISAHVRDFAARAATRRLLPADYQGGASAVSNLGMYGVESFSAILNPPQSTILAVGQGTPRVVVRNGAPAVAQVMSVTLSCDHRVVDGAVGAQLLAAFKNLVESPNALRARSTRLDPPAAAH
jgi:pyruvate dehydrogenase E2 component (dihydrolipoamide acetyltransferase)